MRLPTMLLAGGALAGLLTGCGEKRGGRVERVRSERHVCTLNCHEHHHNARGRLEELKEHRHGPGCGHAWRGDRWVVAKLVKQPSGHVCGLDCHDHHYDRGGRKVVHKEHKHGPNCGHHYNGQRWVQDRR